MAKSFLFALLLFGVFELSACRDEASDEIVSEIVGRYNESVSGPVEEVWKYRFDGKTFYYIPPKCCDVPSILFDANGQVVCSPDGGFTGDGDGRCPDFFKRRKNGKLVWNTDAEESTM